MHLCDLGGMWALKVGWRALGSGTAEGRHGTPLERAGTSCTAQRGPPPPPPRARRPDRNAARIKAGAQRLSMPEFPEDEFVRAVEATVKANAVSGCAWGVLLVAAGVGVTADSGGGGHGQGQRSKRPRGHGGGWLRRWWW